MQVRVNGGSPTTGRAVYVCARLLPLLISFLRDRRRFLLVGRPAVRSAAVHRRRAARLADVLGQLGPTFVKIAQFLGSRIDLLGEPYVGAVAALADAAPPLPPGAAEELIEAELGEPVERLFARFDSIPFASASVGQVHRASHRGREVAVKILRPGVEPIIAQDLRIVRRVLSVFGGMMPDALCRGTASVVAEFEKRIRGELDLRLEARYATHLRKKLADDGRWVIPEVIPSLTRRRVMVLDYVEGTRIDRLRDRLDRGELYIRPLMRTIVDLYLRMFCTCDALHCDPHAGNLLVDPAGRIVLLDFGNVVPLGSRVSSAIWNTVLPALRQDTDGVIDGLMQLGVFEPHADHAIVRSAMQHVVTSVLCDEQFPCNLRMAIEDAARSFRDLKVTLPSELVYFLRAAVLLEGIGLRYDPNFNIMAVIRDAVANGRGPVPLRLLDSGMEQAVRRWISEGVRLVHGVTQLLGTRVAECVASLSTTPFTRERWSFTTAAAAFNAK